MDGKYGAILGLRAAEQPGWQAWHRLSDADQCDIRQATVDVLHQIVGVDVEVLPPEEPVFVLRAKDQLSVSAVAVYLELCLATGSANAEAVSRQLDTMREWQKRYPHLVRLPT